MTDVVKVAPKQEKAKETSINDIFGNALNRLIDMLEKSTDYKNSELEAESIFQNCEYLEGIIPYRRKGKKYVKYRFPKTIAKLIAELSRIVQFNSYNQDIDSLTGFEKLRSKLMRH